MVGGRVQKVGRVVIKGKRILVVMELLYRLTCADGCLSLYIYIYKLHVNLYIYI